MDLLERAQHYAKARPQPTPAQRRRMRHKENRRVAREVRIAEAKVKRLRGAARKSAQKTLDRLITLFN